MSYKLGGKDIQYWITPCDDLSEDCEFGKRVITSWAFSGFVFGIALWLLTILSEGFDSGALAGIVIAPVMSCMSVFYGFIGIGFERWRGTLQEYKPGWDWYIYPWLMLFVIAFRLSIGFVPGQKTYGAFPV